MNTESGSYFSRLAVIVLCALVFAGCAVNPATGKKQFMLVSESQEIAIGRENDKAISAQMGLYEDEAVQRRVQELGDALARRSERPHLDWTFRVLDDPVVNAFALPGGYIYITRGILAHLDSEAELCTVIGHEIGHVTARHGASQLSKAQLLQGGMVAGAILLPEKMDDFGGLLDTGLGLLFLKFGRDDERQADDLGLRYLIDGGYDPRPASGVFDMLGRVSAASGSGRVPGWLSTHPNPENRAEALDQQVEGTGIDYSGRPVNREEYLDWIDGITFGEDPREGYFEENLFLHPAMRFKIEFPSDWKLQNHREAVVAVSEGQDALVELTLAGEKTHAEALERFFSEEDITRTGPKMGSVGGFPTSGDGFAVGSQDGGIRGRVGFVEYGGRVFRLIGYSKQDRWSEYEQTIRGSLASFGKLTDPRALEVRPKALRIVRADRSTTLEELARKHDASVPLENLALLNRVEPTARLRAGDRYKIITGGKLP